MLARFVFFLRDLPLRLRRHTAGGAYRPEIDGLRFLAIAIVVLGHLTERLVRFFPAARDAMDASVSGGLLQRPGLGVYLFFTVSGFILATQAAKASAYPLSPVFLRRYFTRRILRIEPPYLLLLLATFLFVSASGYVPDGTNQFATVPSSLAVSFVGSVAYLHDLVWGTYPRLFPPGWSLEVEVQFYVIAPLFFALWFALPQGLARAAVGVLGLILGSLLSLLAPAALGPLHLEASLLRYVHFFWLGLVLADAQISLAARLASIPNALSSLLGWGALALYLVLPNAPDTTTGSDLAVGLGLRALALGCVAAMFAAVLAPDSGFRRFCARPWISLLGGACYSLYLTHLQIIQAMTSLAAKIVPGASLAVMPVLIAAELAVVFAIGLAFYAIVERTFMRPDWPAALRRRFRSLAPAAV